jgi:hypothetical protein
MLTCVSPHMLTDGIIICLFYGGCLLTSLGGNKCYDYFKTRSNHAQIKKIQ